MCWSDEYPLNLLAWITEKRSWFTLQANIHRRMNSLYFKVSKRQTSPGSHGSKLCTHHLGRCHLHAELISWAPWAQFIWIQPPWLVLILFVSPSKELCCLLTSKSDTLSLQWKGHWATCSSIIRCQSQIHVLLGPLQIPPTVNMQNKEQASSIPELANYKLLLVYVLIIPATLNYSGMRWDSILLRSMRSSLHMKILSLPSQTGNYKSKHSCWVGHHLNPITRYNWSSA